MLSTVVILKKSNKQNFKQIVDVCVNAALRDLFIQVLFVVRKRDRLPAERAQKLRLN